MLEKRSERSTDWIRQFVELHPMRADSQQLRSDKEIYQGKGPLTRIKYYSAVYLH